MPRIYATQRAKDCGVAAFANYFGIAYEDVYAAAIARFPAFAQRRDGLGIGELRELAKAFGLALTPIHWQRVNLDEHEGVLGVNFERGVGHWVALVGGLIIDSDGPCYEHASRYLEKYKARAGTLLTDEKGP